MICGLSHGNGGSALSKHLESDENERVEILESNGLFATTVEAQIQELTDLTSHARTNTPLLHAHMSPEPGQTWSDEHSARAWADFERAHGVEGNKYMAVQHYKKDRLHEHRVYVGLTERGTKVRLGWDRIEREYMCRKIEFREGHPLVKGRFNKEVYGRAETEYPDLAAAMKSAGLLGGKPAIASMTHLERMQAKQTGIDIKDVRTAALEAFRAADNGAAFRNALDERGLHLAQGKSQILIVDSSGAHHGLNRVLRAAAKDAGQPPISANDSRAMLTGIQIPAVSAVQADVRGSQHESTEAGKHGSQDDRASSGPSIGHGGGAHAAATVDAPDAPVNLDSDDPLAAEKALKQAAAGEKKRQDALASTSTPKGGQDAAQAARRLAELITGGQNGRPRSMDRPTVRGGARQQGKTAAGRASVHPARRGAPQTIERMQRVRTLDTLQTQQRLRDLRRSDLLRIDARDRARVGEQRVHHSVQQPRRTGGDRGRGGLTIEQQAVRHLTTAKQLAVAVLVDRPKSFDLNSLTANIDADLAAKVARLTRQADQAEKAAIDKVQAVGIIASVLRTAEYRAAKQAADRANRLRARADEYATTGRYNERRARVGAAELQHNGRRAEQQKYDSRPDVRRAIKTVSDVTAIRALCRAGDEQMIAAAAQSFDAAQKLLRQREQEERERLARDRRLELKRQRDLERQQQHTPKAVPSFGPRMR